jgi:hypothetical protein
MSFTPDEELLPQSAYIKPPVELHHFDARINWWVNTRVPDSITRIRGVNEGNKVYVFPNELMAWHLYEDRVIPDSAIEASRSLQPRQGPRAEDLYQLHCHILEKCGKLMHTISSLIEQYWGHQRVIKYGAPKLKHVNTRVSTQPVGYERDIFNRVEEFEK